MGTPPWWWQVHWLTKWGGVWEISIPIKQCSPIHVHVQRSRSKFMNTSPCGWDFLGIHELNTGTWKTSQNWKNWVTGWLVAGGRGWCLAQVSTQTLYARVGWNSLLNRLTPKLWTIEAGKKDWRTYEHILLVTQVVQGSVWHKHLFKCVIWTPLFTGRSIRKHVEAAFCRSIYLFSVLLEPRNVYKLCQMQQSLQIWLNSSNSLTCWGPMPMRWTF